MVCLLLGLPQYSLTNFVYTHWRMCVQMFVHFSHIFKTLYLVYVNVHVYICYMCGCIQVREQLSGIGSLLPLCVYYKCKRVCVCVYLCLQLSWFINCCPQAMSLCFRLFGFKVCFKSDMRIAVSACSTSVCFFSLILHLWRTYP